MSEKFERLFVEKKEFVQHPMILAPIDDTQSNERKGEWRRELQS